MIETNNFTFHDPGVLVDQDLSLRLTGKSPADPATGYVPAYEFTMTKSGVECKMGHIRLRIGQTHDLIMYAGQIGYDVCEPYRGNKYAARSCRLILPLARLHALPELWITCDPRNFASQRTCELIGAEFVETVALPQTSEMYRAGDRFRCRYRLPL